MTRRSLFRSPDDRTPADTGDSPRSCRSSKLAGPGSPRLGRFDSFAASWPEMRSLRLVWLSVSSARNRERVPNMSRDRGSVLRRCSVSQDTCSESRAASKRERPWVGRTHRVPVPAQEPRAAMLGGEVRMVHGSGWGRPRSFAKLRSGTGEPSARATPSGAWTRRPSSVRDRCRPCRTSWGSLDAPLRVGRASADDRPVCNLIEPAASVRSESDPVRMAIARDGRLTVSVRLPLTAAVASCIRFGPVHLPPGTDKQTIVGGRRMQRPVRIVVVLTVLALLPAE
jgi:hypothetical protein